MPKNFISPTHNGATTPLPKCPMLKTMFMGGVAKFTWLAQPLCRCVLDGNIGPRGEGGLTTEDPCVTKRYAVALRTFFRQQSQNRCAGYSAKKYRVASDARVNIQNTRHGHMMRISGRGSFCFFSFFFVLAT